MSYLDELIGTLNLAHDTIIEQQELINLFESAFALVHDMLSEVGDATELYGGSRQPDIDWKTYYEICDTPNGWRDYFLKAAAKESK